MTWIMPVAASAEGSISVQSFQYDYDAQGRPGIQWKLKNEGDFALAPKITIALKKAYSGREDAYVYRKKAVAKPGQAPVLLPGRLQTVRLRVDRLLEAGQYEADIDLNHHLMSIEKSNEFSVADEDTRLAKPALKKNHLDLSDKSLSPWRIRAAGLWLVFVAAGAAVYVKRSRRS